MRSLTDAEIIESVRRGNQGDYSLIVDRYKQKGFSLLKRMLKNNQDAEEVLQDCFLKAYQSLSNFRGDAKFSTWFYRIVYNAALSFLSSKRKKLDNELSSIEDHLEIKENDDRIYAESEDIKRYISGIIEQMPEKYSAIIVMFYMEEMTLDEISKVTGLSLVNTKVILHRARGILRDLILKHNYQEEIL